MTFKVPFWILILAFLGILGAFYYLGGVTPRQDRDRLATALKSTVKAYNDTIQIQTVLLNGIKQSLTRKDAIILSQKEAIQAGLLDKKRLKKINAGIIRTNTNLQATISTLKDSLKNHNKVIVIHDTVGFANYMKLPAQFKYSDKFFKLGMDVTKNKWNFNALATIPATITVGDQIIITTPNPYVKFTKINSVVIPPKTKLWNRRWYRWGERAAIAVGFFWLGRQ